MWLFTISLKICTRLFPVFGVFEIAIIMHRGPKNPRSVRRGTSEGPINAPTPRVPARLPRKAMMVMEELDDVLDMSQRYFYVSKCLLSSSNNLWAGTTLQILQTSGVT